MTASTIIRVENVSKRFVLHKDKSFKERIVNFSASKKHRDDFWALRDINLDIKLGSTVGLIGHNGSGKSTLLKVIGGIIEPTTGTVRRRGRMAALLELGAGFHPDLTGRENVYLNASILGLPRQVTDKYFDAIVDFSGIEDFIDTQVKFYSSGMYVRLAFSVAVHVDPDLLLVDEVLAVGDEPFQRKCMDKIAQFQNEGRTIVLVSHSAEQVGQLCDRVVVLNNGVTMHDGDPSEGIRILREGYESDRRQSQEEDRSVNATTSTYAIAAVSAETRQTSAGRDVVLDIDIDITSPQPEWGIGLSIENTLGLSLYGITTFDQDVVLPNSPGRHTVRIVLPDIRLGEGMYLVNVGVGNQAGVNYDRAPLAASFEMPATDNGHGILRLDPQFSVN